MNLSDSWKSAWPVGAVFAAPTLLAAASAAHLPPFFPFPSSPFHTLFHSLSLSLLPPPPIPARHLTLLPFPSPPLSHLLFFPAGPNSDYLAFLALLSTDGPDLSILSDGGDLFRQRDGFAHPAHPLTGLAALPPDSTDSARLLARTLYSVNCFVVRVVSGLPRLVPSARRTFSNPVVDASWNPHVPGELVVLLETGDLFWLNADSRRGVKIPASGADDVNVWLRCEFSSSSPWVVFLASSTTVTTVDLRSRNASRRRTLARIDPSPGSRFLGFARSDGQDSLFCVATPDRLLLYDARQESIPVLSWSHGIDSPGFLSLHPLRDFGSGSGPGFGILIGSSSGSTIRFFCCGPRTLTLTMTVPTLYAWELPSDLWREEAEATAAVGFAVIPAVNRNGFRLLLRLASGRIVVQEYEQSSKLGGHGEEAHQTRDPPFLQNYGPAIRHDFLDLKLLRAYLRGDLRKTMARMEIDGRDFAGDFGRSDLLLGSSPSVLSVHEMASRAVICSLGGTLARVAFSPPSDLFPEKKSSTFEFLPWRSFLRKPANRSIRDQIRDLSMDGQIVGPVLPLPFLLNLQRIEEEEEEEEDLMGEECRKILGRVYPEISIAASEDQTVENDFQVHVAGSWGPGKEAVRDDKFCVFLSGVYDEKEETKVYGGMARVKLSCEPLFVDLSARESEMLGGLKRQFSKWLDSGIGCPSELLKSI
ncbi:TATA box-binding protein associated factor RNA polymerase I subunit C [Wolffia australiana]